MQNARRVAALCLGFEVQWNGKPVKPWSWGRLKILVSLVRPAPPMPPFDPKRSLGFPILDKRTTDFWSSYFASDVGANRTLYFGLSECQDAIQLKTREWSKPSTS